MSGLAFTLPERKVARQYVPSQKTSNPPESTSYKAKVYIFEADGRCSEEQYTFDTKYEMNHWANERAALEHERGRRIKVVWTQSLVSSGTISFL